MATCEVDTHRPGFSFENCMRNQFLQNQVDAGNMVVPKVLKTGTTICGLVFKDGVILGADTRATGGNIVANKNCEKLHNLASNIYCAGAGTAADCDKTTSIIAANLKLHSLETQRKPRVITAARMLKQYLYRYRGMIGTYLIVGGVDVTGPSLLMIHAGGSVNKLPFATMGSGSLAAMAVFERSFRPNMELDEAKELVADAIRAGIFNDLGSGSNVDICVIKQDSTELIRPYDEANKKGERHRSYKYPRGVTRIISSAEVKLCVDTTVQAVGEEAMET